MTDIISPGLFDALDKLRKSRTSSAEPKWVMKQFMYSCMAYVICLPFTICFLFLDYPLAVLYFLGGGTLVVALSVFVYVVASAWYSIKNLGFVKSLRYRAEADERDIAQLLAFSRPSLSAMTDQLEREIEVLVKRRDTCVWLLGIISSIYFLYKEMPNIFAAPQVQWIESYYKIMRNQYHDPILFVAIATAILIAGLPVHVRLETLHRLAALMRRATAKKSCIEK